MTPIFWDVTCCFAELYDALQMFSLKVHGLRDSPRGSTCNNVAYLFRVV